MAYLMGIDYGTGGAKACIIDEEGQVMGYGFEEYPIITPRPGWSEHDPRLYWEIACLIINQAIEEAGIDAREIKGVGTSSALPSLVMIDSGGRPLNRAYNLMDRRAVQEVEWINNYIGAERVFEVTANRLDDHPILVNLLWEKNNRPESFGRIHKALTIDGYIRYRLTGRPTLNYSAGSFYGVAYDIRRLEFDEELMDEIGIDPDLMPEGYRCDEIIGEVTRDAAEKTGLAPGTAVPAGQVDCNAAWVGAGAIEDGDIQMNLGTCGNFGIVHRDTEFLQSMIACPYTIDSRNMYITIPTTTTGGQLLRYMRDEFSQLEVGMEKLLKDMDAYDLLNLEAEKVPPGSEGLIVLPYLQGERTPIWDAQARGVVFGLSLSHTKGHLIRAIMESVAYALYDSYRLIEKLEREINFPLVLNEGGAKSRLWRRIITDVFNVPTAMVENRVGAPFGDAILAGVAAGVFPDFTVAREWANFIEPMEPNKDNHDMYMEYFQLYKSIYSHVKDDFMDLAELREKYV